MAKNRNRARRATGTQGNLATRSSAPANYSDQMMGGGAAFALGGSRMAIGDAFEEGKAAGSAVLARCINLITLPAATVPTEVYNPVTGEAVAKHPVADLFNGDANPDLAGHTLTSWILASLCTPRGQAYAHLPRPKAAAGDLTVNGIYPLTEHVDPQFAKPTRDRPSGAPYSFRARVGDQFYDYQPEEVLWFKHTGTANPWAARNPLRPAENAITLSWAAQEYLLNSLRDGVSVGGMMHLGEAGSQDDARKAAHDANRKMTGKGNANKVIYTSGPTAPSWTPFGLSPVDMALVEMLGITDVQIIQALGVPRELAMGESTYENRSQARAELWENAILPLLRIIEAEVTRRLLKGTGLRFRYDVSGIDALSESQDSKVTRATSMANSNSVLVDEIRETLDMDPLPGGAGQVIPAALLSGATMLGGTGTEDALVRSILSSTDAQTATVILAGLLANRSTGTAALVTPAALPTTEVVTETRAKFDPNATVKVWDRLEKRGRQAVAALAAEQVEDVLNRLERTRKRGTDEVVLRSLYASAHEGDLTVRIGLLDLFDPAKWAERSRKAFSPWIERVWNKGAEDASQALGVSFDVIDNRVHETMAARLDYLADQVNSTTAKAISEAILKPGIEDGDSIDALADRLRTRFDQLSTSRAKTIARTETVGGYNSAHRIGAVESGVVKGRKWHSKIDTRTRDSHEHLHGHTLDNLDNRYPNGLQFPGDPSGKAEEVINCRCVEEYIV